MTVQIERSGPAGEVWTVVIDRPGVRNAVDGPTARALAEAFRAFDADDTAACAVLCGAGGTFCAGADLRAMSNDLDADPSHDAPMGPSRMRLRKPVIAAINGHAVAGGLELALWCDLRIVEADAVLGVFSRRWGVPLIDGGTVRLPQIIGLGRALDLILTGRTVTADEALSIGLVTRVVAPGQARTAAEALAEELARLPQAGLRSDRESTYTVLGLDARAALGEEFALGHRVLDQARTGAARFADGAGRHGRPGE